MTASSATLPRYAKLGHWRGIPALSVVLFQVFHHWDAHRGPAIFAWLTALAEQGYRGVHLFFVISGYRIAHLSMKESCGRRDVGSFLRQRFLRIIPPYWIACGVAAFCR